jgi:hypothetical protein
MATSVPQVIAQFKADVGQVSGPIRNVRYFTPLEMSAFGA